MTTPQLLSLSGGAVQGVNPVQSSAGSSSAGSVVALNSSGQIDPTMLGSSSYNSTNVDGGNSSPNVASELPALDGGTS